jgi:hypothetical protein
MMQPVSDRLASFLVIFSLVFTVVYTVAYYNEWALFRFYPLVGEVHFSVQPTTLGPAMIYYNWIALSAVAALSFAVAIPPRWTKSLWSGWSWVVPLGATLFTFIYETRWFGH